MNGWILVLYTTPAGRCPVAEYLDALDQQEAARVRFDIDLLQQFGLELGAPHVRSLGDKLWELRIRGRVQHRVMYFAAAGRSLVLLHAFGKKTPKTPAGELDKAKKRMSDYLKRMG